MILMNADSIQPILNKATAVANGLFSQQYLFKFIWKNDKQISVQHMKKTQSKYKTHDASIKNSNSFLDEFQHLQTLKDEQALILDFIKQLGLKLSPDTSNDGLTQKEYSTPSKRETDLNELADLMYGATKLFNFKLEHRNQLTFTVTEKDNEAVSTFKISVKESNHFLTKLATCQTLDEKVSLFYQFLSNSGATRLKDWELTPLHPIQIPGTLIEYAKSELNRLEETFHHRYYQPILSFFDNYTGSKKFLILTWDNELRKLVKQAPTFKEMVPSFKISEKKRFDSLILSTQNYTVTLKEDSARNQLQFEINQPLVSKLIQIKDVLETYHHYLLKLETLFAWFEDRESTICQLLQKADDCDNLSEFYPYIKHFHESIPYKTDYRKLNLVFKSGDVINFEDLSIDEMKQQINSILDNNYQLILNQMTLKKQEMEDLKCDGTWKPILSVIQDSPRKGIKTYVDILRGSKSAKIKEYNYDTLDSYAQFGHLSSQVIESKIEESISKGWVKRQTFKASFGRYEGLILTSLGEKTLRANLSTSINDTKAPEPLTSFKDFVQRSKSGESVSILIPQLSALNTLAEDDISLLIQFILNDRKLYRSQESDFITTLTPLFPASHQAVLDLNIALTTGVTQKTFKMLKQGLISLSA